jgi:hypothetical protein
MAAGRFPVEAGHVLAFGRALGLDEGLPRIGDVAPPTFAIASAQFDPHYPLRPRPGAAPVAEFSVSTVAQSTANGEGREVMSGYAHARLAR